MNPYRVQLDTYNGPLDLLYYLIRQEEVDIYDIPIARITKQYIEYVNLLEELDPDGVADYLVLLATLIEIKSRTLLPRVPAQEDEAEDLQDPRLDLVRRLLEYKKYKDAAYRLADAAEEQAKRFPSPPLKMAPDPEAAELEDLEIWDLMGAFNRLMAQIGQGPETHEVVYDDTPMALHAADILDRLQREEGSLPFERIFLARSRQEIIGLFLTLLELIRQRRVRAEQEGLFGVIVIHLLDATPLEPAEEVEAGADLPEGAPSQPPSGAVSQENEAAPGLEVSHDPPSVDEEEDDQTGAELQAIDSALERISDRLEEDRKRQKSPALGLHDAADGGGDQP